MSGRSDCSSLETASECGNRDDISALSTVPSGHYRFIGNSSTYGELEMLDSEAETTVTIPLSPELLNSLHRRRWRHLRGIEKSCKASIRLDRSSSTLHVSGTEESVAAVKHRLAGLNGPRRNVSTAVWAELMRTRTVQDSRMSVLQRLQEESGCRIHIERSSREVRIFGTEHDVKVAERLLDELEASVTEVHVEIDPSLLGELVLESLMHSRGVMVQVEGKSVRVFGKKEAVIKAVEDIREYVANPHSNRLLEAKAKLPPAESVPTPITTAPTLKAEDGRSHHQHGGQPKNMQMQKQGAACPTCGAANFCPCCGAPVWQQKNGTHQCGMPPSPMNYTGNAQKDSMQMGGQMQGGFQLISMPADMQSSGSNAQYMPVQYMGGQAFCMVPQNMMVQMQQQQNSAENQYAYTMHGSYGA